jgi:hypothetical protein
MEPLASPILWALGTSNIVTESTAQSADPTLWETNISSTTTTRIPCQPSTNSTSIRQRCHDVHRLTLAGKPFGSRPEPGCREAPDRCNSLAQFWAATILLFIYEQKLKEEVKKK